MAERNRYLRVDVIDPEGRPASPLEGSVSIGGLELPFLTGQPVAVPAGRAVVNLAHPAGRFELEVEGEAPETPTRLELRSAELLVWLGDPGGRDFGGLPVIARGPAGEARGRVGQPFTVWAGKQALEVGDEAAGVAPRTLEIDVASGRKTLELGRLASLVVRWGEGHGWPVRAVPIDSTSGGLLQRGRTSEPISLWPGRYRIEVDGGPTGEIDVRAGRLAELDLAGSEPPTVSGAVVRASSLVAGAVRETGDVLKHLGIGALAKVAHRLAAPPRVASRGGDARAALPGAGPSIRVHLRDARGYSLTGWPLRLAPVAGGALIGAQIEGRVGMNTPAMPGRYRIALEGLPGTELEVTIGSDEVVVELPPLAGLDLILRDGLGASMRGGRYRVQGADWTRTGVLGQILPLPAGEYRIETLTEPAIVQQVKLEAGVVAVVDLGALGRVDISPGPEVAWGTPVWILSDPVTVDGPLQAATVQRSFVGQSLHLPAQAYQLWVGRREGEGERLELRGGRMRRPTVVGRGFEALAPDDTNT